MSPAAFKNHPELFEAHQHLLGAWEAMHRTPPQVLYHYTNAAGLMGMLSSQRLWATHISYMNDHLELDLARLLVQQVIAEAADEAEADIVRQFFHSPAIAYFQKDFDVYVACFCEEGDLLSQWRAYGANGSGYALALQTEQMGKGRERDCLLRRVIYEREVQQSLLRETLSQVCGALIQSEKANGFDKARKALPIFVIAFSDVVSNYMYCFKHEAFREEKEWRAVFIPKAGLDSGNSRLRFRAAPIGLVPYAELDITPVVEEMCERLPVDRIRHGPTLHPDLTKKALQMLLRQLNYPNLEIQGSEVPYRP